jgi:MFS family permease
LITVALPAVAHSLGVSGASTSVILSVYFTAYALTLLPGGVLVDRLGARRVALAGLALFALGAAVGALCTGIGALAVSRVVQGIGAGLVSPAALAGAVSGFPPERRGRALGVWGASAGVSNLLGPLLGGLLTVAFGWRADWWALVPASLLAAWAIASYVPPLVHDGAGPARRLALAPVVLPAAFIAALTFAVMIGSFYIAEQYLQHAAGYSALGASAVLIFVALLVGIAAPLAGRLSDRYGERLPTTVGFLATAAGLVVLGIPGVSLRSPATLAPLIPVGLGLGMLFVPVSRAALNATPDASHGRVSAALSIGRLLGAAAGAGLAGLALSGGIATPAVHEALWVACAACLLAGIPASFLLPAPNSTTRRRRTRDMAVGQG